MKKTLLALVFGFASIGCAAKDEFKFEMAPPGKEEVVKLPDDCKTMEKIEPVNISIEEAYCRDDSGVLTIYTRFIGNPEWTARRYEH